MLGSDLGTKGLNEIDEMEVGLLAFQFRNLRCEMKIIRDLELGIGLGFDIDRFFFNLNLLI